MIPLKQQDPPTKITGYCEMYNFPTCENCNFNAKGFCENPNVNGNEPYFLRAARNGGNISCEDERAKRAYWAVCGMRGKAWEPKTWY